MMHALHGFTIYPHELELGAVAGHSQLSSCLSCDTTPHLDNMLQTSSVSDYDLGGEGDLFKAPKLIIQEPVLTIDPISLISSGSNFIAETIKALEMESIRNDNLNELLAKPATTDFSSEISDFKISAIQVEHKELLKGLIQKSVSTGCLRPMDCMKGCIVRPNFLELHEMDYAAFGMRRAFSEGDIQILRTNNSSHSHPSMIRTSFKHQLAIGDFKSEQRMQLLSRYRKKKNKRNFGRKIKYACRKALADSQPRVRGRFAKNEEIEAPKPH